MTCAQAIESLLDADLSILQREDGEDTPLARHLGACDRCRSAAEIIVREEALLAESLSGPVPPLDLNRLFDHGVTPLTTPDRRRLRAWTWSLVPLAAAAVLAALLLTRSPDLPGPPYTPSVGSGGLDVAVPDGRTAAVIATDDPEITILWLF